MIQADVEQEILVRRQLYGSGERSASSSLRLPGKLCFYYTTTHAEAAISNSPEAAPGPSLLSQNDKCRSHPPCSTNLDRARQTMRGATHALISFRCVTICQMRRGGEALPGLRPGPKRLLQARRSRGFPCHQPTISLAQRHKNDAELLHRFSIPPPSDCFLPQHFESFFFWPLSRSLANLKEKKKRSRSRRLSAILAHTFHPAI